MPLHHKCKYLVAASVCNIPTEAEELWIIAVTISPISIASIGLSEINPNIEIKSGFLW